MLHLPLVLASLLSVPSASASPAAAPSVKSVFEAQLAVRHFRDTAIAPDGARAAWSEKALDKDGQESLGAVSVVDLASGIEMLAEVYGRAGRFEEGLRAVGDAFAVAERHGIVFWNAELHRRRGELLLASGERSAADACFQEALTCARLQEARSLELRAAVSLARLRLEEGKSETIGLILRPVYESFSEGFDTLDLTEAHQLLEAAR